MACDVSPVTMFLKLMSTIAFRKEVEEFFDEMDRDFDGRLSFSEFMGEETPLEKLFKSMDKDGDGTVTKEVKHLPEGWILKFQMVCEFFTWS